MAYLRTKVGMDGLDPVALLGQNRRVLGKPQHKATRRGQTYFFSSADNLHVFLGAPELYLPQFDGHCAMAYSLRGKMIEGLPSAANCINDKFYFFSNPWYAQLCRACPAILEWGHRRFDAIEGVDAAEAKRPAYTRAWNSFRARTQTLLGAPRKVKRVRPPEGSGRLPEVPSDPGM
jgi:YHS domain-containing protein